MPQTDFVALFLVVASVCAVILTVLATAVSVYAIRAILEVQSLVRLAQKEVERFASAQRSLQHSVRFASRWADIILHRISNGSGVVN